MRPRRAFDDSNALMLPRPDASRLAPTGSDPTLPKSIALSVSGYPSTVSAKVVATFDLDVGFSVITRGPAAQAVLRDPAPSVKSPSRPFEAQRAIYPTRVDGSDARVARGASAADQRRTRKPCRIIVKTRRDYHRKAGGHRG
jgi:hypothetical protein